jgi:hypothetical protein
MILQDIIRNVVLYNGVIDPYLKSVKEYVLSLFISSYKQPGELLSYYHGYSTNKTVFFASDSFTGTLTIPNSERLLLDNFKPVAKSLISTLKVSSNSLMSMLVSESVANSSKTYSVTMSSRINSFTKDVVSGQEITTGSYFEYTSLFFSCETHEKREYLGEFSLPHEENHFNSFIERR